jgi:hypothetical protein
VAGWNTLREKVDYRDAASLFCTKILKKCQGLDADLRTKRIYIPQHHTKWSQSKLLKLCPFDQMDDRQIDEIDR